MLRYDVESLTLDTLQMVKPIITIYEYKPYHYIRGTKNDQLNNFVMGELKAQLQLPQGNYAYLVKDGAEAVGLATLRMLPWDKQIFKKKMATIDYLIATGNYSERVDISNSLLSKLSSKCKELGVEHLSVRMDTADLPVIYALEEAGFRLMDVLVTYCFDFSRPYDKDSKYSCNIRGQEVKDTETVVSIARISFHNYIDRFHSDPTLDNKNCDQLYANWVRNACLGLVADQVVVAEIDEEMVGFATYKFHRKLNELTNLTVWEWELGAVSPEARHKDIYTSLLRYSLSWGCRNSANTDAGRFIIKSQIGNAYIQRAWSNLGLSLVDSQVTFHKWF